MEFARGGGGSKEDGVAWGEETGEQKASKWTMRPEALPALDVVLVEQVGTVGKGKSEFDPMSNIHEHEYNSRTAALMVAGVECVLARGRGEDLLDR